MTVVTVLEPGPLTTVQDLGRPGYASLGVSPSGAADRASLRLGNRLLGNDEGEAALEATFGGLRLRPSEACLLAVTGAPVPVRLDGREIAVSARVFVRAGSELRIGTPTSGLRTYVAVRGGWAVEPVLGSRSSDLLSGLGPAPLGAGTVLPVGPARGPVPATDLAPLAPLPEEFVFAMTWGPRDDWFPASARSQLSSAAFRVTPNSNRVGLRLSGPALLRFRTGPAAGELPPEGLVRGAIQVPPDGQPVVFLSDHPVTGGYPVIAVLEENAVDLAAQARPGQVVRFRAVS